MTDFPEGLKIFLRRHPQIGLLDATRVIPEKMFQVVQDRKARIALVLNGVPVAALVPLEDLELLEVTDHGLTLEVDLEAEEPR